MLKVRYLTGILWATLFLTISTSAFALGKPENTPDRGNKNERNDRMEIKSATMRSCEARQGAVVQRMSQLVKLATNMESVFDRISSRVQTYYTDQVLPSGKSLSNYSNLLSDISTKRNLIQTNLDKTKNSLSSFNCTNGNARTLLNQFRIDMQTVKDSLKNYRSAINNLIVAVHTISPEDSPSPTPSESEIIEK